MKALRRRVRELEVKAIQVEAAPDRQISLSEPDAPAMATTGKGTGLVKTRRLNNVAAEMSLQVLAYNLRRAIAILGVQPLMAAIRA